MDKPKQLMPAIVTVVAFACFSAVPLLVRQDSFDVPLFTHYSGRVVEIIVCFIIAFISRKARINPYRVFWLGVSALLVHLVFDNIRWFFPGAFPVENIVIFSTISGIFNGIQLACFVLLFARVFCSFSVRTAAIVIPIGWVGTHLIFLFCFLVPQEYYMGIKLVLAIVSAILLYFILRNILVGVSFPQSIQPRKEELHFRPLLKVNRYFSLYFGMLIFPFFYGLMAQICTYAGVNSGLFDISSEIVGISILLLLVMSEPLWKNHLDAETIFIVILPIFATAMLFFPFFWGGEIFVSGFITKCGFLIYSVLMWMYLQKMLHKTPDRSFFYFGIALGLFHLALMLGRLAAFLVTTYTVLSDGVIAYASLAAVWLLSMAALIVLLINRNRKNRETEQVPSSDFDTACNVFGETYGLSERELTVVKEFARGRTASYIAQTLVISEETVKTHLKRSYTKSSCHSRQELLDKIDSVQNGKA